MLNVSHGPGPCSERRKIELTEKKMLRECKTYDVQGSEVNRDGGKGRIVDGATRKLNTGRIEVVLRAL